MKTLSLIAAAFILSCATPLFAQKLHVMTYSNKSNKGLVKLDKTAKDNGISLTILGIGRADYKGKSLPYKGNIQKASEAFAGVCSLEIADDDIVMFLDAFDTLILADEKTIIDKFLAFNCDFVIGAEKKCSPKPIRKKAHRFPKSPTSFRFINSGCYIGYAKKIREILSYVKDNPYKKAKWSDQAAMISYYFEHPENIRLDYDCEIVLNCTKVNVEDVEMDAVEKKVFVKETSSYPCVIHGNGNGKKLYKKIYSALFNQGQAS